MKNYVFVFECSKSMRSNSKTLITSPQADVIPTKCSKLESAVSAAKSLVAKLNGDDIISVLLLCGDEIKNVGEFNKITFDREVTAEGTGVLMRDLDNFNATRENSYWSHNPNTYLEAMNISAKLLIKKTGQKAIVLFASMNVHDYENDSEYYALREQIKHKNIKLYLLAFGFGKAFTNDKYLHDFHIDKDENMSYMYLNDTSDAMGKNVNCILACNAISKLTDFYAEWKGRTPVQNHRVPDVLSNRGLKFPTGSGISDDEQKPDDYGEDIGFVPSRTRDPLPPVRRPVNRPNAQTSPSGQPVRPIGQPTRKPPVATGTPFSSRGTSPQSIPPVTQPSQNVRQTAEEQKQERRPSPPPKTPPIKNQGSSKKFRVIGNLSDASDIGDSGNGYGEDDDDIITSYGKPGSGASYAASRFANRTGGYGIRPQTGTINPSLGSPAQSGNINNFGEDDDD